MADNRKYYYLKLKEDFFESDEAVVLESMPDGYIYSNILLKLYLRSLKNDGFLMFNNLIPYNSQMLATITRHQVGTIEKAVKIFKDLQLIDILDNGAIYMTNIKNFVGKSSTDADRKRLEYNKMKRVGEISTIGVEKTPPEIEIEKEKDIEIKKDIYNICPIKEIIEYLNSATGKSYRYQSSGNKKIIQARWNEGYKLDAFKKVIDNMVANWTGTEWEKYLQPSTLFRESNFDKYLNMVPRVQKTTQTNVPDWTSEEVKNERTAEGQAKLAELFAELEAMEGIDD